MNSLSSEEDPAKSGREARDRRADSLFPSSCGVQYIVI
jgi:hypothetical protein